MSVADALTEALTPWRVTDPDDLGTYAQVLGRMFLPVEVYAADRDDGTPGWSVMLDPDLCPVAGLPYLAQWVGERLPVGLSEAEARQWIKDAPNQKRGTPTAMALAAFRRLTGSKSVMFRERTKPDGSVDVDHVTIKTFTTETPDPVGTLNDILFVSPADIQVHYSTQDGPTWGDVELAYATWADVEAANATWADVMGREVGFVIWNP